MSSALAVALQVIGKRELAKVTDATGREHLPAGPGGGQFTGHGGGGGGAAYGQQKPQTRVLTEAEKDKRVADLKGPRSNEIREAYAAYKDAKIHHANIEREGYGEDSPEWQEAQDNLDEALKVMEEKYKLRNKELIAQAAAKQPGGTTPEGRAQVSAEEVARRQAVVDQRRADDERRAEEAKWRSVLNQEQVARQAERQTGFGDLDPGERAAAARGLGHYQERQEELGFREELAARTPRESVSEGGFTASLINWAGKIARAAYSVSGIARSVSGVWDSGGDFQEIGRHLNNLRSDLGHLHSEISDYKREARATGALVARRGRQAYEAMPESVRTNLEETRDYLHELKGRIHRLRGSVKEDY